MNDRLVSLAGALLSLLLVYTLLNPNAAPEEELSLPTSIERGVHGLAGLYAWLGENGVATYSLRHRYDQLALLPDLPAQGNLMILSHPARYTANEESLAALDDWLRQGNDLLLLVALSDAPQWSDPSHGDYDELEPLGITLHSHDEDEEEADETVLLSLRPVSELPLLEGVREVQAEWHPQRKRHWHPYGDETRPLPLPLLEDAEGEPVMWRFRHGEGRIWLSAHADLFSNAMLGRGDNARLLSNLVGAALADAGVVIFDDRSHGLFAIDDPEGFYQDPRLHHTAYFIFAFWLIYVLGYSNRLLKPRRRAPIPSPADEARAAAGFLARRLHSSAAAELMLRRFFDELRGQRRMSRNGQPLWSELAGDGRIPAPLLQGLRKHHHRAESGRRCDLGKLQALIHEIRSRLQ